VEATNNKVKKKKMFFVFFHHVCVCVCVCVHASKQLRRCARGSQQGNLSFFILFYFLFSFINFMCVLQQRQLRNSKSKANNKGIIRKVQRQPIRCKNK
jgi:hypothetical protein